MRVVIHVGAHKTGTSLVQKYFRDNPEITEALGIAQISPQPPPLAAARPSNTEPGEWSAGSVPVADRRSRLC